MNRIYKEVLDKYSNYDIDWNLLKNKTIIISGSTGLIGRFMVDLIMNKNEKDNLNCKVIGLCRNVEKATEIFYEYRDNDNLVLYKQDVIDPITYQGNTDYVIHAASNTHPIQYATDPIGTIKTNVYGTVNLLDYSVRNNVDKFILLSSFEVYGQVKEIEKIGESDFGTVDCTILRSCYPESKRLSENLTIAYSEQRNLKTNIVRLSRVFGPTMSLSSSLATAQFLKNAINDEDIVLKSNGKQLYSYNYVGDAVTAILTVMLKGKDKEAYNVSDEGYDMTLGEFAQNISNYNNKKVVYDLPNEIEKKGFSNSEMTVLDSSKLKELGWSPLDNIGDAISSTIRILKMR